MTVARRRPPARAPWAVALLAALVLGAGAADPVRVDTWDDAPPGPLDLAGAWQRYPPGRSAFRQPPAIVLEAGRPVLQLATSGEAMRVGRAMQVDLRRTPWLAWEWKALELPAGGDLRDSRRNDQVGRVMVAFEGLRGILYVWDTTAPVGAATEPDPFELFQRVLIVVRSGPEGLGQWARERRNVLDDYRRLFDDEPRPVKLIGLESHSNDTGTRTAVRFGRLSFEPR